MNHKTSYTLIELTIWMVVVLLIGLWMGINSRPMQVDTNEVPGNNNVVINIVSCQPETESQYVE